MGETRVLCHQQRKHHPRQPLRRRKPPPLILVLADITRIPSTEPRILGVKSIARGAVFKTTAAASKHLKTNANRGSTIVSAQATQPLWFNRLFAFDLDLCPIYYLCLTTDSSLHSIFYIQVLTQAQKIRE